jgi:psiF repeat-containing protein
MKLLSALTLTALLSTTAAFAADNTTGSTAATPAPAAKHMSLKACNKQADEKKLTGADRSAFVKECHGSKKAASSAQ